MSHESYADPIMNDGPGFHSNMPVSELTERVTRAIEASDVCSAPPIVDSDSPDALVRPMPGSANPTCLIPRCTQRLGP